MEVPEVELGPSIVAGEDLTMFSFFFFIFIFPVVEDDRVHLVRVVELCSLVLVDDERQEVGALILCLSLVCRGLLIPAHLAWLLVDLLGLNTFYGKLSKVLEGFVRL